MIAKRLIFSFLTVAVSGSVAVVLAQQPQPYDEASERALRHATPEWESIANHLPDPATATPASLIQAADVLRARRLPEDALDYYRYALKRGGDQEKLENDIGVTLLELRQYDEARAAFKRAIQLKPKNGQEWNNLGAAEYVSGNSRAALTDYLRAVKLDKKRAVFHSNLGTAYFELKDYESARAQFEKALQLDRNVFQSGGFAGVEAHVLGSSDHGRFCFEMAKMSAKIHDDDNVVRWLARASEAGFDVKEQMAGDKDFEPYRKDVRIETAIRNAKAMRTGQIADSGLAPPIPSPSGKKVPGLGPEL
jgi:tetratricopeptide (TPR) repeat protein